jgi:TnsA endonuclease C terminal/TnsA endonuclease N terminal
MTKLNATPRSKLVDGPVRAIGVQSRSITGTMPNGNRYESALERDFMLLMQFDAEIDFYTPQPLTMPYRGSDGQMHKYTPDGLIEWRSDKRLADTRPVLVEIKYREAFQGEWRKWRALKRAAMGYANDRGWDFQIYTEREIRTPFLDNVRFLLPYKRRTSAPEIESWVIENLRDVIESTPRDLITMLYRDKWNQASLIPVMWRLLAERRISFDITLPLNMQSPIWIERD